jgi:SNF2 family DNA or RNA helicase
MFLYKNNFGGCLSDDMGLGKTIQVLAFLLKVKQISAEKREESQLDLFNADAAATSKTSLIVMPLSLVHNWESEIKSTTPNLKFLNYTGLQRRFSPKLFEKHDLVLTTYGTLRNDFEKLSKFPFRFVFLDESQYIKNPESKIFSAVSKLTAEQRFVITGTPVENSLVDLWSQLQFVNPGLLGDLKFFRDHFYQPIEKRGSKTSEKRFRQIINPFILRRTKNEVAKELPELTEKIHYCPMTPEQQEIYERRKSEIRNYIIESTQKFGAEKAYMIILSGLMRLRLLANHPSITEKDYELSSGKFDQVTESIQKVLSGGHKVLIFSQFVKHLSIYADYLEEQNIPYLMLTGQTNAANRQSMIKQFQKGYDYPVFLMSLKAGGVGLNLTAADFVFLLDPWWNPAVEQQAINRTHRIGQDKKVISYKFITEGTIEEKIIALQEKKQDLFNNFVNFKAQANLSPEELKNLLD